MKNIVKKLISIILMTAIVLSTSYVVAPVQKVDAAISHPFLLTKGTQAEYDALRALATQEPWKGIKTYALGIASGSYKTTADAATANYLDCCALAYVLETNATTKADYKNKIYNTLNSALSGLVIDETDWAKSVPPGSAYFCGVLAYDIIYNDLTSAQITNLNTKLSADAKSFYDNPSSSWAANTWGAYGMWQLFTGNTTGINTARDKYVDNMHATITDDGVAIIGPQYTKARYSSDRYAKQYFMDVLDYTDTYDCYSDPEFIKLYEWFYGHALTPFKKFWIFGDAYLYNSFERVNSIYKAANFSDNAGAFAQRLLDGYSKQGGFLAYVLHKKNVTAKMAPSKIYNDGGAYLYENSQATTAQASAMWNIKPPATGMGHTHKEVNAINVVNYGQTLLANAGYPNWNVGMGNFPFEYFNNRAVSANTALIDYSIGSSAYKPSTTNDHSSVYGGGVTEGITTELFGYASGDSGNALPNGKHIRNLVSVFPQDSKNGYWVLFDEVDATTGGVSAGIALHPVSKTTAPTVTSNKEYKWACSFNDANNPADLSVFLGTAPSSVQLVDGCIASSTSANSIFNKYIYSKYTTDSNGKKNIVTVLFPSNASYAKATMARISGTGYTGASIDMEDNTIDYALESSGTSSITYGNATFQGLATLYREVSGANKFYFVRSGKSFKDGSYGFSSNSNVSVYMDDTTGKIVSPGCDVTFNYPGVTGVKLNDELVSATIGNGTAKVNVPAGDYSVELTTEPVDPVDPEPEPTPIIDENGNIVVPVKADAYVQSGVNENTQYGSNNLLIAATSADADWSRKVFAKFGFSSLTQSSIYQAKLRLYVSKADAATSRIIKLYETNNEWWTEVDTAAGSTTIPAITWKNAPEPVTGITYKEAAGIQAGDWLEFDVTNYVNSHMTDKAVSFELINESSIYTSFNSKQATANQPQLVITPVKPDPDVTVTVNASADSFVYGGDTDANNGALSTMESKGGSTAYIRRPYLKFNFSTVTESSVKQATLKLYVYKTDTNAPSTALKIFGNSVESWTESGINWSNAPANTTEITSTYVGASQAGTYVEFDVTSYINSHLAATGDKTVSLELVNDSTVWFGFNAKEASANNPQLVITY